MSNHSGEALVKVLRVVTVGFSLVVEAFQNWLSAIAPHAIATESTLSRFDQ